MKKISVRGWELSPNALAVSLDGASIMGTQAIYFLEHGYGAIASEQARNAARLALDALGGRRRTSFTDGSRESVVC